MGDDKELCNFLFLTLAQTIKNAPCWISICKASMWAFPAARWSGVCFSCSLQSTVAFPCHRQNTAQYSLTWHSGHGVVVGWRKLKKLLFSLLTCSSRIFMTLTWLLRAATWRAVKPSSFCSSTRVWSFLSNMPVILQKRNERNLCQVLIMHISNLWSTKTFKYALIIHLTPALQNPVSWPVYHYDMKSKEGKKTEGTENKCGRGREEIYVLCQASN